MNAPIPLQVQVPIPSLEESRWGSATARFWSSLWETYWILYSNTNESTARSLGELLGILNVIFSMIAFTSQLTTWFRHNTERNHEFFGFVTSQLVRHYLSSTLGLRSKVWRTDHMTHHPSQWVHNVCSSSWSNTQPLHINYHIKWRCCWRFCSFVLL